MKNNNISLLQISDFHLFSDPAGELMGLNTGDALGSVLDCIRSGERQPDLLVASGDLVHDGSAAGYQRMQQMLESLSAPVYCMPGNHDEKRQLREHLNKQGIDANTVCAAGRVDIGNWRLVLLDSVVSGEKYGHITTQELRRLAQELDSAGSRHVLIFLHHQPVPVGSLWLDSMQVDNAAALFEVVDRSSRVRAIAWGHVHQAFDSERNGVRLLSAPATCIQFMPGSGHFALDETTPGWRWFELAADGRLATGVQRLPGKPRRVPSAADASGYS